MKKIKNISNKSSKKIFQKLIPGIALVLCSLSMWSQTSNSDFERIKIIDGEAEFSGLDIAPDQNTIAVSSQKPAFVKIIDWKQQQVIREINGGNLMSGSIIKFSENGKYLLLQEIGYTDFSQNKNRETDFEIADVASGRIIKSFSKVQDVVISADEKAAVSLENNEITFWSLPSGEKERSFIITNAGNAIAFSNNGKLVAVAQNIEADDYKNQFKKDSKGLKNLVKFKQVVSFFDAETGEKAKTVSEFYDIIYNLDFLHYEDLLFVFQTPDIRVQANNSKLSYVNLIDMENLEPLRKGFTSMSTKQPDLKAGNDRRYFAINSKGNRFQEMHLYSYETAELEKRFELGHRLFEKVDGEKMLNGSRLSFVFLPGNQSILIAMGSQLIKWNIEFNSTEQ